MRRTLLFFTVAAGVAIASACSSFDAADNPPAVVSDAGQDVVQQPDAPSVADADADAGKDGGYCASRTGDHYCEDFDSLSDVKGLLPESSAKAGVALTQSAFVSPTRALSFSLSPLESSSYAVVRHAVLGNHPVRVEADMLFGALEDTAQTLQSLTLTRKNGAVQLGRACAVEPDAGSLTLACSWFVAVCLFNVDGATVGQCTTHVVPQTAMVFPRRDTWQHVALEATFAEAGNFKLSIDNQPVFEMNTATYDVGGPPLVAPTIATVGIAANQGTPAVNLFVDNVVVTQR